MAYVAVCRPELNAADWNLNCDLAVANCESAAELPIKAFLLFSLWILVRLLGYFFLHGCFGVLLF